MFVFSEKVIRIIGAVATMVGIGASLLNGWVGKQNLDYKIDQKITEALAKRGE